MSSPLQRARFRRDHRWAPRHMSAFADGELTPRARARLERHTEECPDCRSLQQSLQRMLSALRAIPSRTGHAPDIAAAVRQRLNQLPPE
ncbi:MAG: zf-HC2 domain-containing protein [Solirubrobacterales bacterium]|nr:zf-HC2 domain-containing protein [Solirubrobacterales bacterium]